MEEEATKQKTKLEGMVHLKYAKNHSITQVKEAPAGERKQCSKIDDGILEIRQHRRVMTIVRAQVIVIVLAIVRTLTTVRAIKMKHIHSLGFQSVIFHIE